jgi:hypothetical protein
LEARRRVRGDSHVGKVATPGAFLFDFSMEPLFQALFPVVE